MTNRNTSSDSTDVLVAGAGLSGLIAALAFGREGYKVTVIDPVKAITAANEKGADLRTTAFLQPAKKLLEQLDLWNTLSPYAMPLQTMRIIDAAPKRPKVDPYIADFNAQDVSSSPFGWNIPNWRLRREILSKIEAMDNIDYCHGLEFSTQTPRDDSIYVTLSNGKQLCAKLLIGADGRHSKVRSSANISARCTHYKQSALTFMVTHPKPHHNVSTEVHDSGGPFTLVPLPDHNGQHCSAVVWMDHDQNIKQFMALPQEQFEQAASDRSYAINGPLTLISPKTTWPIITQQAKQLTAKRMALIAEAAHVIPPIGAQGLNMSLSDITTLLSCTRDHGLGTQAALSIYQRKRTPDLNLRIKGVSLLNKISMSSTPNAQRLRAAGLQALHKVTPIRKKLMKLGLGGSS